MTDRRDEELDEGQSESPVAPARTSPEGVRILGAEEAQAAMDAGTVGRRLGDQDTRYGDVPARPDPAIRPTVRFPRSADQPDPDVVPREAAKVGGVGPTRGDPQGSARAAPPEERGSWHRC